MASTETIWITPDITGAQAIMDGIVTGVQDSSLNADTTTTRSQKAIVMVVSRIRGAILNGGRVALSLIQTTVPPEAEQHVAALVVQMLIGSNPDLARYVIAAPGGSKPPIAQLIEVAEKWMADIEKGKVVVSPSLPDPAFIGGIYWGDQYGDLNDYASGTNADNGSVVIIQDMNTHV